MVAALLLAWAAAASQDVEDLHKAGTDLLGRRDFKGALLQFEKAITLAPDRAELYLGRGKALMGLNLIEDAEKDLSRALELDPAFTAALYLRGQVRRRRGAHAGALADLDRCLERGAQDPDIFVWKGLSLNQLARFSEAEEQFSRALAEGPPSASAYTGRAWARMLQGNLRGTISDETRSIELDPADPADYARRGFAYYGEESWENALRDLLKTVELEKRTRLPHAHWTFLCRLRLGRREAAIQELRDSLKDLAREHPASSWEFKLLAFDVGDLDEAGLLEAAAKSAGFSSAHFAIATRLLLSGKAEEALKHFQKSHELRAPGGIDGILAGAEIRRQWRLRMERLLEELDGKVRNLPLFEAAYEVDMPSIPDDDRPIRSFTWTADVRRRESVLVVGGRDPQVKSELRLSLQLKDAQLYVWKESDDSYLRLDFSFMPRMIEQLDKELAGLVGPGSRPETGGPVASLGVYLEGKPSKDGEGKIRFTLGFASTAGSWLKEPPGPEDTVREGKDEIVFEIPSRRKKVVIDRHTGLLKLLETMDYDGTTRRTLRLVSYKPVASWPTLKRPEKEAQPPADFAQFRNHMLLQEGILQDQVSTLIDGWDKVVADGKEEQAAAILTRWAAQYADGIHAHVVRSLAGNRIKSALDLGTPASTLLKNEDEEARRFAEAFAGERKRLGEFMKADLAGLAERTENGLFEKPIDSRRHAAARALVRKAFHPPTVERLRHATFGDRLEQLFREELRARTRL